ncbi:MAG TPA: PD-(D/E)XK nuclease domain-containing protein [Myxococcota bacterium]|nr:PD-(D/E)XK nuclease domain-containing protein [Myxococcota bacterium]
MAETQAEAFYHAFVLGLLVTLEKTHPVRSNREVGRGRADVWIAPKSPGQPGVLLEFKAQTGKGSLARRRRPAPDLGQGLHRRAGGRRRGTDPENGHFLCWKGDRGEGGEAERVSRLTV